MNAILDLLNDSCLQVIKNQTGFDDRAYRRLLSVHLDPRYFAMPIHSHEREQGLRDWAIYQRPESEIQIQTEDTNSIKGVIRVLIRTHINRQGINQVRRGAAKWPVQSPRVLDLVDATRSDQEIRSWTHYGSLMDAWLKVAHANHREEIPSDQRYDDGDLESIERLATLCQREARSHTAHSATRALLQQREALMCFVV